MTDKQIMNNNIDGKNKETKWENPLRFKPNQTCKKQCENKA